MRTNTIYMHIGVPKTGTTSIQWFLRNNKEQLKKDAVYVPELFGLNNHMLLTCLVDPTVTTDLILHTDWTFKKIQSVYLNMLQSDIEANCDVEDAIVMSSEQMSSRLSPQKIDKLKNILSKISPNIKIIIYLRRQDKFLVSNYSTRVKIGHYEKFDSDSRHKVMNYEKVLNTWGNVFGEENIIVRKFEKESLIDGDLINDILSKIKKISLAKYEMPPPRNLSLDIKLVEFLRRFNSYCPLEIEGRKNGRRGDVVRILEKFSTNKRLKLNNKQVEEILHFYSESNRRVAQKYFQEDELFLKSDLVNGEVKEDEDYFTIDDSIMIAAKLWEYKHQQSKWLKNKYNKLEAEKNELEKELNRRLEHELKGELQQELKDELQQELKDELQQELKKNKRKEKTDIKLINNGNPTKS